jgi:hypothetical protein
MKPKSVLNGHAHVVDNLRRIPRKMLELHERDNVTEFVLHELSGQYCFDLPKAAYFIDNPDFNCMKGVVGVSQEELHDIDDIWKNPEQFTSHMKQSPFNQHVRSFTYQSNKKNSDVYSQAAEKIANELGIGDYGYYSWGMKHNNHGLLVCEKNKNNAHEHPHEELIVDGLCLLGFCPVH